jgi:hypothetical protein
VRSQPDGLKEALIVAGVRRAVAARVLAELEDHAIEVRRELEAAGLAPDALDAAVASRLGSAPDIAGAVASDSRALAASRRWPWLVFGLGPFAAAAAAFAFCSLLALPDSALGDALFGSGAPSARAAWPGTGWPAFAAWSVAAAAFCTLAGFRRCPLRWPALAAGILAAIAGLVVVSVHPAHGERPGFLFAALATGGALARSLAALAPFAAWAVVSSARSRPAGHAEA